MHHRLFSDLYQELCYLDETIKKYDLKLEIIFKNDSLRQKLSAIEGLRVISVTALVSAVGNPKVFKNGQKASLGGVEPHETNN